MELKHAEPDRVLKMLHAFFPDKLATLATALAAKTDSDLEYWNEVVIAKLIKAVQLNAVELERAYSECPLFSVAYYARNLLELEIWIEFCGRSKENAKQFLDDSVRDTFGMLKATKASLSPYFTSSETTFADIERQVLDIARPLGFTAPDDGYKRVSVAADELNKGAYFKEANKVLSKYAHPTAWIVIASLNDEQERVYRVSILVQGVLLAVKCVQLLNQILLDHGYDVIEQFDLDKIMLENIW